MKNNISRFIEFSILNKDISTRVDKLIYDICESKNIDITRTKIQELIQGDNLKKNDIIFNGSSYKVKITDKFIFSIPEIEKKELKPNNIPLNIIYEDEDVAVINKQSGLTTHPGAGNEENTLANALLQKYGNKLSKIGGEFRPGIVHRLDKDTSGLMIIAKNDKSHLDLSEQLQSRALKRNYIGFIWNVLNPKNGTIEGYTERSKINRLKMEIVKESQGRYSLTHYKTLKTFLNNSISMVNFELDTGRTHQIRVHCSYKGCPIIGDTLYGGKSHHLKNCYNLKNFVDNFPRQALYSYKMQFIQPSTKELKEFEISLPEDMQMLLNLINDSK